MVKNAGLYKDRICIEIHRQFLPFLKPVSTGDFCRSNSMQFLSRRSCNGFKIVRLNQLRFQRYFSCDLSQLVAAISQEFRTCSKIDAILRRFLTKLNHKGPLGGFCDAGFQFVFVWLWLIQTKNLHYSMSSSSPSTGNSISDTQTGSSNSKVFLQYSSLFTISDHFRQFYFSVKHGSRICKTP